jgi:Bax protein
MGQRMTRIKLPNWMAGDWLTNRRILLAVIVAAGFGVAGPGLFGLDPPKWFPADDDKSSSLVTTAAVTPVPVPVSPSHASPPEPPNMRGPNSGDAGSITARRPHTLLASHIPAGHLALSGAAQKQSFIDLVLPLIAAANAEIDSRRAAIQQAFDNGDRLSLEKWAALYKIDGVDLDDETLFRRLLFRADKVPVPLALAQAAIESGWGTSRFARDGNALFGQWAWTADAGIRPLEATDDRVVVRSFSSLFDSVRAYIHNLNTHYSYADFRAERAEVRTLPARQKTDRLVTHLHSYAEIGMAYVKKLQRLIKSNNLYRYAMATS